jgi:hypothetical protein
MAEAAAQFQKGLDRLALLSDSPECQRHTAGILFSDVRPDANARQGLPL